MGRSENITDMAQLKARLEEIVDAVGDESIPLDDALSLYEEAVSLGMRASEMVEEQSFDNRTDGN